MKKLYLLIICLCLSIVASAQNGLLVTTAQTQSNGASIAYTVGDLFTPSTLKLQSVFLTPYTISVINELEKHKAISLQCSTYPNPVVDELQIKTPYLEKEMHYTLFDANGKEVKKDRVGSQLTILNLKDFKSGIYILQVYDSKTNIKSFKIIKQ